MKDAAITVVFDVGAHIGVCQFLAPAWLQRTYRVVRASVMPPNARLRTRAAGDSRWNCHELALSDRSEMLTMHVGTNEVSSSGLERLPLLCKGDRIF